MAMLKKAIAVKIKNRWLIPGRITPETPADKVLREKVEACDSVIQKMREHGFSDDEIAAIHAK